MYLSETEYELEKTEKVLQEVINEKATESSTLQQQASLVLLTIKTCHMK